MSKRKIHDTDTSDIPVDYHSLSNEKLRNLFFIYHHGKEKEENKIY
jgi:hypothetical protein